MHNIYNHMCIYYCTFNSVCISTCICIYMYILHYITVYVEKRGPCECLLVAYEELVCPKMLKVGCPTALQQICPKKIPFSQNSQGRVHCDIILPYFTGPFQRGPSCCRSHIVRHQVPAPGSLKFIHEICGHLLCF